MRITSGIYKNQSLTVQKKSNIRPTTDKVRSAIFSIIGDKIKNTNVLDLYAGTGSFGIEALSRGAANAIFVDIDISSLKQNISTLKENTFSIKKSDSFRIIKKLNNKFDIIFIDPPYLIYNSNKILNEIYDNKILANKGILIYEESIRTNFEYNNMKYLQLDFRTYGETAVYFLGLKE